MQLRPESRRPQSEIRIPLSHSQWIVHKFGGTSVANAERYRHVAAVLDAERHDARPAVVVSAMSGVTDMLLRAVELASRRDPQYEPALAAIRERHHRAIAEMLDGEPADELTRALDAEINDIADVLRVCWLLRSHARSALELVSGYGEVWSARLLSAFLAAQGRKASWLDAREVLVVEPAETTVTVDWPATQARLDGWLAALDELPELLVVTGFVASTPDGVPTTLGRNGSDYTASIFGALLGAGEIHIWTDVDGVMSADPRLVPDAVRIDSLSYDEAMELAYFGAKVIHPSTMAPAVERGLPIRIRNTFRPEAPGTRIHTTSSSAFAVKGLTSISGVALVNVEGTGMIGVPGTAERLFGALRDAGVSVIMISQASSEHSICVAVPAAAVARARQAIEEVFFAELHRGQIGTVEIDPGCCILAAVGDGMAGHPGVAAKFFGAVGSAGVNIRAIAQGSSERNISVVVSESDTVRALRAAHSGFYLSSQTLSIGVIGCGVVGGALLDQLASQAGRLREECNLDLRVRGIATSSRMLLADRAIGLAGWRQRLADEGAALDPDGFVDHVHADHLPHAVLIDCTASDAVARRYPEWLRRGIHVITPNKRASTAELGFFRELQQSARANGTHYLYETTVGAGLPVITTLRDLIQTGDRVLEIEGVLSGTLSFLFNVFDGAHPFSAIVREARERGYTEPDPRDDLSGMDVARKLVILGREMRLDLEVHDVDVESLVPAELQQGDVAEFLEALPSYDARMAERLDTARAGGEVLRYVAHLDQDGRASVRLASYPATHPFARVRLTDNIVQFRTERYDQNPLLVQGPGAGPEVTAGGVFADLLRLAAYLGARL
jgi:bifunctional aspartokinase / homoserine dehydrogenase 1